MPAVPIALPKKIISRKDEITAGFFSLLNGHIRDLLDGKVSRRYHAADFGAMLFIHPRHLTNTIKLTTGKSPCDFMEERLIAAAQKLLTETELSVADISERFGYSDPTNFIKFFKSMCGITPLQFRKNTFPSPN